MKPSILARVPRARPGEIGHQREAQAAVVGGVLAERQPAVDVRVAGDRVAGILIGDAGGALFVGLAVGGRPPVAQVALAVELAALIVEAVRQLVADHRAGARRSSPRRRAPSGRTAAAGCRRGS